MRKSVIIGVTKRANMNKISIIVFVIVFMVFIMNSMPLSEFDV